MRWRIILACALVVFLAVGCVRLNKFNAKTAQKVKDQTIVLMDTVQDYLIAWPLYSGWIRRATEPVRDRLPSEFFDAMDSLDELAKYCPGLTDPPPEPGSKCDFSEWQPEVVALDSRIKVEIINPVVGYVWAELGPTAVYEGKKRTEFGTGWAAGDATIMASSIVMLVLKELSGILPGVADILKILPVLAL